MRTLAATLRVSPATINLAYRILRERGLIVTAGRRGTRISSRPPLLAVEPAPGVPEGVRDLSAGLPDPGLLPDIAGALRRIDLAGALSLSEHGRDDPRLLTAARQALSADGISHEHLAVTSGAFDAIERVLGTRLRPGDRVLVEDPTYGAFRDLLTALGLIPVPVAVDDEGAQPAGVAAALRAGASAALLVPRAQNPTGAARSQQRTAQLRALFARHPEVMLIEDDHAGAVAGAPHHPLGATGAWAVVRSVSKTLHPDLRLAVVAGDATTIGRLAGRQALGPRWVSPILQATVAEVLRDPALPALLARAADTYARRRAALIEALAANGIDAHGRSGLNVWVAVREELAAVNALGAAGYAVAPGERFRFSAAPGVRITTAVLPEDEAQAVARALAVTERPVRRRAAY